MLIGSGKHHEVRSGDIIPIASISGELSAFKAYSRKNRSTIIKCEDCVLSWANDHRGVKVQFKTNEVFVYETKNGLSFALSKKVPEGDVENTLKEMFKMAIGNAMEQAKSQAKKSGTIAAFEFDLSKTAPEKRAQVIHVLNETLKEIKTLDNKKYLPKVKSESIKHPTLRRR